MILFILILTWNPFLTEWMFSTIVRGYFQQKNHVWNDMNSFISNVLDDWYSHFNDFFFIVSLNNRVVPFYKSLEFSTHFNSLMWNGAVIIKRKCQNQFSTVAIIFDRHLDCHWTMVNTSAESCQIFSKWKLIVTSRGKCSNSFLSLVVFLNWNLREKQRNWSSWNISTHN